MKLVCLLALLLLAPAAAQGCQMTSSNPEVDTGLPVDGAPRFYVDNDLCHFCLFSIWVYQESNGIDGLQRGDEVVDDTCGGAAGASDTIVF
jgi:hypothetical protein